MKIALAAAFILAVYTSATAQPAPGQRSFLTPEAAVKALQQAAKTNDRAALRALFGPDEDKLRSGDPVEDAQNASHFEAALAKMCRYSHQGADKVVISIGDQDWPFPIPVVRRDSAWYFDTAAGKQEIIDRHIGEDELAAIRLCHEYVQAQREYASEDRDGSDVLKYAQLLKSTPGKKDGLYWEPTGPDDQSPFGPLVAEARAEGYGPRSPGAAPRPFHGYFFKILAAQGSAVPGGAYSYIINGNLISGFALVAYPAVWGESGFMTFIVNQRGRIYQANLGPDTAARAASMTEYNPDRPWKPADQR
jgi:hypothetical protein